jgi:DNA-binding MarR family transcriptional regulator
MDAVELYLLGRKLLKIAESAFPDDGRGGGLTTSVRMILIDVSENPGSSIGEITARTGFPQSHVSASVARLRDLGALETSIDARDGRRTVVRLAEDIRERRAVRASLPIDGPLASALGTADPADVAQVTDALEGVAERLIPRALGRIRSSSAAQHQAG